MSAPEPRVRVERRRDYAFDVICDVCGRIAAAYVYEGWATKRAERHRTERHAVTVAALQARWDARDEALRTLVKNWRSTAGVLSVHYDATGEGELRGRSKVYQIAADELERAMEESRG